MKTSKKTGIQQALRLVKTTVISNWENSVASERLERLDLLLQQSFLESQARDSVCHFISGIIEFVNHRKKEVFSMKLSDAFGPHKKTLD
jgi:hypothetical protein